MATAGSREPPRDLYQVLGVARDASREEIALAWRRRARDEHPDARRRDPGAPARFRAVADAWQVLGDPARRTADDWALAPHRAAERPSAVVRVTVRRSPSSSPWPPPLAAGPVWVEGGPRPVSRPGGWDEEDFRLALLAALMRRYRGRPW
jgi:hypothetical protein